MAKRKVCLGNLPENPELERLLEKARKTTITEEELEEQRVSFAYGNAPSSSGITKESVRQASKSMLMRK